MPERIHVMVGILTDEAGRVLLTQRLPGSHMAGRWEFPGGKRDEGETRRAGLCRELHEELGITVRQCEPLIRFRHRYPERVVLLDVWRIGGYEGVPAGVEGQALKWVPLAECWQTGLLPADRPIVDALGLPDRYVITPPDCTDTARLAQGIAALVRRGVTLIQLRVPQANRGERHALAVAAVQAAGSAKILINGEPARSIPVALATGAAGIHVPSRFLDGLSRETVPSEMLIGVSCHDAEELVLAAGARANFAVLGPVLPTRSHPEAAGLGWQGFADLVDDAAIPVYALGGVGPQDVARACRHGGLGVAGISAFWPASASG